MLFLMLSLTGAAFVPAIAPSSVWAVIAVDPIGDAPGQGPDAAQLAYQYDTQRDIVWFRLGLYDTPNVETMGLTIAVDTGARDTAKTTWWGGNQTFTFDRLVSARLTRTDGEYRASIVVTDAARGAARPPGPAAGNDGVVRVEDHAIVVGVPRARLLRDSTRMNLIAAVGPEGAGNDEIPNVRSLALDLAAPRPTRGLREIDVSRNNLRFAPGQPTLADAAAPRITSSGSGRHSLILIPGVYAGSAAFARFIARNHSAYTFHVVTPPGLSGTPPRPLPPEGTSFGDFTWTRRLERDVLDLIARKHLDKPVIVAHGFPGSLAAEELAVRHPEILGGVIEIAGMPVQPMPTMRDPSRQATPAERVSVVDEAWSKQWFTYVTPETWESNNYPAEMFANDPQRAEQARREIEAAPLPVKIRYLAEYMAWDGRADLGRLEVPLLALVPGFNESLLANPAFGWFKTSFQDGWEGLANNAHIERIVIPDGRASILDEQAALTDRAIAAFVERTIGRKTGR